MSDIVERLRGLADLFEAGDAPRHLVLHMRAGADEIERLRAGGCARDQGTTQYCAEAAKKDAEIASLLNTLADERTESMRLRARVTELEGQHKGLVLNNAILRERPDLPLNRIPAARAMTKLYEDNERLRAALEQIASLDVPRPVGHTFRADGVASKHDKCWHGVTMSDECGVCLSNYARAALEGK